MSNQVKAGDFLKRYSQVSEIIFVKEHVPLYTRFDHEKIWGLVVACSARGLSVETVLNPDLAYSVLSSSEPSRDGYKAHDALTKLGPSKFGTLYDMAEAMWEYTLGKGSSDYSKTRVITRFLDNHADSLETKIHLVPTSSLAQAFSPFKSDLKAGNISLTRNLKDLKADRQTSMKPGRAFRYMFPTLTDNDVSLLAEAWLEETAPRVLTLHTGSSPEDFAHCYHHERSDYRNPTTTSDRKSIATSCMQGVTRTQYEGGAYVVYKVGEAYASGDFLAVWIEDQEERIAGRVVVGITAEGKYHGPLYGACEQSLDMLQAHLESISSEYSTCDWVGLSLKSIGNVDSPLVPYLDGDYSGEHTYDGFIKLLDNGEGSFGFENTDGYISEGHQCECCGDTVTENDMYITDGGPHCEHCFDEHFVVLDCGAICNIEYAVLVKTQTGYGGLERVSEVWVDTDNAVWCEGIEEYWHENDVTCSEVDEVYVPTHRMSEFPELFPDDSVHVEEAA